MEDDDVAPRDRDQTELTGAAALEITVNAIPANTAAPVSSTIRKPRYRDPGSINPQGYVMH
jgi:hypothetical protein